LSYHQFFYFFSTSDEEAFIMLKFSKDYHLD